MRDPRTLLFVLSWMNPERSWLPVNLKMGPTKTMENMFISHQFYGKLAYHRKRDQDLMEKSKRDKKKTKKRQYGKKWWKWTHTLLTLVFGAPRNSCQFRRSSIKDMNTLAFRTDSIAWPKMYNNRNKVYILIHLRK